ncbi:MAG: radical SAM protein, partial [Candidatus Omnitrophota bacterium]
MKCINEEKIRDILSLSCSAGADELERILEKSRSLKRLTLEETACLLNADDPEAVDKILNCAKTVKAEVYGQRVVLFAPLYINNICLNYCKYCSFKADNKALKRKKLSQKEIAAETEVILKMGHKRILIVASQPTGSELDLDYYIDSIRTVYSVSCGDDRVRRVNVNLAPVSSDGFKRLKAENICTYQLFQETYCRDSYENFHPRGPKKNPDTRFEAIDKAFEA